MATATAEKATQEKPAKASKNHPCKCLNDTGRQCPDETTRAFARGHDARMSSRLAEAIASKQKTKAQVTKAIKEAGGSDLLVDKTLHSADLRIEKDKAPAKAKAEKQAAAKGKTAAKDNAADKQKTASKSPVGTNVKVQHDGKDVDAVVVRDAAGDLVARHRHQGKNHDHPYNAETNRVEDELDEDEFDDEDEDDEDFEDEDE